MVQNFNQEKATGNFAEFFHDLMAPLPKKGLIFSLDESASETISRARPPARQTFCVSVVKEANVLGDTFDYTEEWQLILHRDVGFFLHRNEPHS